MKTNRSFRLDTVRDGSAIVKPAGDGTRARTSEGDRAAGCQSGIPPQDPYDLDADFASLDLNDPSDGAP
jgi:hypothetical protein